jgi:hypothetical protein
VQAAALETQPELSERWTALLANAADPVQQVQVQLAFVEILRQLTILDAQILETVAAMPTKPILPPSNFQSSDAVQQIVQVEPEAFAVAMDNLLRLRLCVGRSFVPLSTGNTLADEFGTRKGTLTEGAIKSQVALTDLGRAFLRAVTVPKA